MQYYKINIYSYLSGHNYDSYIVTAKSAASAKRAAIARVEKHLDWYGSELCDDGYYPEQYTVEVRNATDEEMINISL